MSQEDAIRNYKTLTAVGSICLGQHSLEAIDRSRLALSLNDTVLDKANTDWIPVAFEFTRSNEFARLWNAGLLDIRVSQDGGCHDIQFKLANSSFGPLAGKLVAQVGRLVDQLTELRIEENCPIKCVAGKYIVRERHGTVQSEEALRAGLSGVSCGRGMTKADAALGCIAEGVERLCLERSGDEDTISASYEQLKDAAVLPSSLQLFSAQQYMDRESWNSRYPVEHHVPVPVHAQTAISWIKASPALSTSALYLPFEHCLFGVGADGFPAPDSSGCSAGSNLEDATVRGFFELVERDAVAIWWYGRLRRPAVKADVWRDKFVSSVAEWCSACSRNLVVLDLTTDLQVPVAAAISWDLSGSHIALGFGSAANMVAAARSALGEMVQFQINGQMAEAASKTPGSKSFLAYPWHFLTWSRRTNVEQNPFLQPNKVLEYLSVRQVDSFTLDDCHTICRAKGLELLAIDLTDRKLGVPVVRVVVPHLRPIWPRFAAGRLYEVPIAQGSRESSYSESNVNSVPILY